MFLFSFGLTLNNVYTYVHNEEAPRSWPPFPRTLQLPSPSPGGRRPRSGVCDLGSRRARWGAGYGSVVSGVSGPCGCHKGHAR
eukprot:scaffold3769_cov37-Tisochrysis_lutea.AAC.3